MAYAADSKSAPEMDVGSSPTWSTNLKWFYGAIGRRAWLRSMLLRVRLSLEPPICSDSPMAEARVLGAC